MNSNFDSPQASTRSSYDGPPSFPGTSAASSTPLLPLSDSPRNPPSTSTAVSVLQQEEPSENDGDDSRNDEETTSSRDVEEEIGEIMEGGDPDDSDTDVDDEDDEARESSPPIPTCPSPLSARITTESVINFSPTRRSSTGNLSHASMSSKTISIDSLSTISGGDGLDSCPSVSSTASDDDKRKSDSKKKAENEDVVDDETSGVDDPYYSGSSLCGYRFRSAATEAKYLMFSYGPVTRRTHAVFGLISFLAVLMAGISDLLKLARGEGTELIEEGSVWRVLLFVGLLHGIAAFWGLAFGVVAFLSVVRKNFDDPKQEKIRARVHSVVVVAIALSFIARSKIRSVGVDLLLGRSAVPHSFRDLVTADTVVMLTALFQFSPLQVIAYSLAWLVPFGLFLILGRVIAPVSFFRLRTSSDTSFLSLLIIPIVNMAISIVIASVLEKRRRLLFIGTERLRLRNQELREKNDLQEELLHDLLPEVLRNDVCCVDDDVQPSSFFVRIHSLPHSIVLWADIVNFTTWCQEQSVVVVMDFLNRLCKKIDSRCRDNPRRLTRYKMVGDAVCCVSEGSFSEVQDVLDVLSLAFLLLRYASRRTVKARVGVAQGQSDLCVYGSTTSLVRFDIFGEAVETANELEKGATPMAVSVDSVIVPSVEDLFCFVMNVNGHYETTGRGKAGGSSRATKINSTVTEVSDDDVNPDLVAAETPELGGGGGGGSEEKNIVLRVLALTKDTLWLDGRLTLMFSLPTWKEELSSLRRVTETLPFAHSSLLAVLVAYDVAILSIFVVFRDWQVFTSPSPFFVIHVVSAVIFLSLGVVSLLFSTNLAVQFVAYTIVGIVQRLKLVLLIGFLEFQGVVHFQHYFDIMVASTILSCSWPWIFKGVAQMVDILLILGVGMRLWWLGEEFSDVFIVLIAGFLVMLPAILIDRAAKLEWLGHEESRCRGTELKALRRRTAALIHSILPRQISSVLSKRGFRGFATRLDNVLVSFVKVDFRLKTCNADDDYFVMLPLSIWLHELASLYTSFDVALRDHSGIPIKANGFNYMGISRSSEDRLVDYLRGLSLCRSYAATNPLFGKVQIGVGYGCIGGGVIGSTRLLFDIWGHPVNEAARLCSLECASDGIAMTRQGIVPNSEEFFTIRSVGNQFLKGIGHVECCLIDV